MEKEREKNKSQLEEQKRAENEIAKLTAQLKKKAEERSKLYRSA
ncbi:MAG: hypothetical protein P4L67_02245 [Candidatus Pacebacteria bacterium]|nr:hypothetical protein [Candidatus Paceibacterota bacterium]